MTTTLEGLLAQPFGQALGWSLLHFLWQGTLIAGILAAGLAFARHRSANLRYLLSCGALLLMVAAPIATLARHETRVPSPAGQAPAVSEGFERVARGAVAPDAGAPDLTGRFASWWQDRFPALQPWMVLAWSLGVALLSMRYLGGWAAAQRLKGRRAKPAPADWQSALDRLAARLRVARPVRLLESAAVRVPAALGVFKPVVLVPAASLTGIPPRHLEALLAHELAHVRRHDFLVNLLQSAVETLLFYHPAVWWVSRRIRIERENCCDDLAIVATGSARTFARALADLEERRAGLRLQTAADGGVLRRRVVRLLGGPDQSEPFPRQLVGVLALSLLVLTGAAFGVSSPPLGDSTALAGLLGSGLASADPQDDCGDCEEAAAAAATPRPARRGETEVETDGSRRTRERIRRGIEEGIRGGIEGGIAGGITQGIAGVSGAIADALTTPRPEDAVEPYDVVVVAQAQEAKTSPSPEPRAEKSSERLTVDQLIAFKVHGVTPEFIREVETLGFGRPSPDDLISLRVHGITKEFIQSIQRAWGKLDLDEIVSIKIHGLTPEFAEEMKKTGLSGLDFEELLSMRIHGVTPEYVRKAQASGFGKLSAEQVVALKIHGVTMQDVDKWKALGFARPDFDDVVSAKIHGLTPEFAGEMRKLGFSDLELEELVGMKIHGVTPAFVEAVRQLGYARPSADEITSLRVHGVSVEELRAYKSAAGKLSLEDVVSLKIHDISAADLSRMLKDGKLSIDDLDDENE